MKQDRPKTCQARQQLDQMHCVKCCLLWDISDPEPPGCTPSEQYLEAMEAVNRSRHMAEIRRYFICDATTESQRKKITRANLDKLREIVGPRL